ELEIWRTLSAKLNWSHFQRVFRVADVEAQNIICKKRLRICGVFELWIEIFQPFITIDFCLLK
ncbi:MAG TPA: hypothetical protein VF691_15110, partial [Cytophagaceae bacterium]